jgi:hypothetical protein
MKTILSMTSIAAGLVLSAGSLAAQTPPARVGAANSSGDTAQVGAEAKEKAEDAALLDQLEKSAPEPGDAPKLSRDRRIQGTPMPGGGGGFMTGAAPGQMPFRLQHVVNRQSGAGTKPLLIRTAEPEPKAQASLEEDLSVMAHILDKAIEELPGGQRHAVKAMGIDVFAWSSSSPIRSLYLDNYGAVFFLSVGFPLIAPPEKHEEEKSAGDSAWEDARQELYGQRGQGVGAGEPGEEYSQEKVDKLKDGMVAALKNATNIRGLKPTEFVTICISGGTSGGVGRARMVKTNPRGTLGGNLEFLDQPGIAGRRTVLTIRASKADVDSYASGKLSREEFQQHAQITAYTSDTAGGSPDGLVIERFGGGTRF